MEKIRDFFWDCIFYLIIIPLYYIFVYPRKFFTKKPKYNFTEADVPKLANIKLKEPFTLYIGRTNNWLKLEGTKWGNPFKLKKEGDRAAILIQHEAATRNNKYLMNSLHELAGHTLGCYCYSSTLRKGKLCHGHTLIKLFKEKFNIQ